MANLAAVATVAFIKFQSYDFSTENDFHVIENNTLYYCEYVCSRVPRCKGYVYNSQHKLCWLKDNFSGFSRKDYKEYAGIKVEYKK